MIGHLCNSKVDVISTNRVKDDLGGWTEVPVVLYKDLPCRLVWKTGSERIMFDKVTYYRDGKLFCRLIDITTKCKVVFKGQTYEIVDINNPHELNRFLVMDIKLVK